MLNENALPTARRRLERASMVEEAMLVCHQFLHALEKNKIFLEGVN